jgi:hypothetical protein
MVWIQDSNGLGPIMQIEDACGGSAGQFGVNIEVTSPFSHATCIRLNPNATYYMSLNWDTVDSTATLAVYTIQGTLVGQTSDTAPGGPVTQIRMSSNENGTDSGTTYYQNVMMQWTSTSDTPLFWTSTAGTDTTPPSTPANLSATAVSSSAVNLSWTASTDNVGVTGYKIFRGGVQIGTSATNSYSDTGLSASTQYSYTVSAYDAAGNNSSQSSSASVTTQAAVQQTGSYPWSGILTPSRAIDWSQAGVTGGIPTNQTQCVTSACQAVTANGANSTTAQIQAAWASAPANTYVFLPAGTYTGVTSLSLSGVSSVTLRGAGANQTIIPGPITLGSSDGNSAGAPNNGPVLVSGNVSQGSTTITLASVPHLKVGNPIILDQTDTTNDNGGVLVLGSDSNYTGQFTAPGNAGPYSLDGEVQNARCPGGEDTPSSCYHQEQIVIVISCNGVTTAGASCSGTNVAVGIRSPLHLSNWSTANNMSAWWGNAPVQYSGIEDLTSDNTNSPGANGIQLSNCSNCWVKGVTVIDTNLSHVQANWGTNDSVVDSYFFLTQNHVTSSYGVVCNSASNMLIQNNIFQAVASPVIWNGTCDGAVVGYNYDINNYYTQSSGYNQNFYGEHGAGINTNLVEGNVANQADADNIHGTANLDTFFRNVFSGPLPACWASGSTYAASTYEACNGGLDPVEVWSYHRFYNVIGNILGTSGVNTAYNPGTENNDAVYQIGVGDTLPNDPNSQATVMLWGNCDSATGFGSCRFVSGEVPSALTGVQAVYSNPVPSSNVLPPSFYLSAKPAWWGSMPWPAIGPDVTGGNITGVGGHAYIIPAEACYNSMGGLSTGGGPLLSFNAANCFPGDFSSSGGSGSSPTISSFSASPSTITYGASTTLSWSVSGATTISIDNGLGVQSGNSVSVSPTVTTTYTLTATNSNGSITSQATVTVDPAPDTTPPTASITSPSTGTDSGTITFSATASDPNVTGQVTSGLKLVTLFVDGSVFATSTSGSISVPLDTTTLTNASHTLTATAIDNAGNNSTVSSVTITVNNTVATKYPRTLSLSSLEGISAIPAGTTITATVISPGSGATLETQSNLTATAGKYTVTFLSGDPQLVNIRVKANGYLSQLLTSVDTTVNSASALTVPQLTAGDLNNDNVVNSLDYSLMNSNWLKSGTGDINGDGIVNSLDFAILKNDWGKSGN